MTWNSNMDEKSEPEIEGYEGEDYTKVVFFPDLRKFKMKSLDKDTVSLFKKRVYDLAGVMDQKVQIYLNGKKIGVKNFKDYVGLYEMEDDNPPMIHEQVNKRWELLVTISEGQPQQVSFVNNICTKRGGTHVDYIVKQLSKKILEKIEKKFKKLKIKQFQIKNNLWVFVNCMIENPAFDSQTKDTLMTNVEEFGSECELSEKFLKQVLKSGVIDHIVAQAKAKENVKIRKALSGRKVSRLLGIPKLEDANWAGTKKSEKCMLILTEGDSAKSLAMAGIDIAGRDRFGVFPLKGKVLNVREASAKKLKGNKEVQSMVKILGLEFGKKYTKLDIRQLRYGSVMIMADQDHDGSHIKGLIINFLHAYWPSLVKLNCFIRQFITPIIKVKSSKRMVSFFTQQDYERWAEGKNLSSWNIKYYKGLGTSTDKEAREYFRNLDRHIKDFYYQCKEDDEKIDMAFSNKRVKDRKEWLANYNPKASIDYNETSITYKQFIDEELIHFSNFSNLRSIPNLMDGMKPGQRKILFSCFKRNLKKEIKVAQLAGYVSEHSSYHHGEMSLCSTIINMAQDFLGSNNINLLQPIGQFGSRYLGSEEAASPRYIFTKLSDITRMIFHQNDDEILDYLEDDGMKIEPQYYAPVIPMVLVNGAKGIGTGWSTYIPSYNPKELIQNIKIRLDGGSPKEPIPWFKGFKGQIVDSVKKPGSYVIEGIWEDTDDSDVVEITELPINTWTRDYREMLQKMIMETKEIADIKEYHSRTEVDFIVKFRPGELSKIKKKGFEKHMNLTTNLSTNNIVAFTPDGKLRRFEKPNQIIDIFYEERLRLYGKRKEVILAKLKKQKTLLDNKVAFIRKILDQSLIVRNKPRKVVVKELLEAGLMPYSKITGKFDSVEDDSDGDTDTEEIINPSEFNYLLSMKLWALTKEKVDKLLEQSREKQREYDELKSKTPKDLWRIDLEMVEKAISNMGIEEEAQKEDNSQRVRSGFKKKRVKKKKKSPKKRSPKKKQQTIDKSFALISRLPGSADKENKTQLKKRSPPKKSLVSASKKSHNGSLSSQKVKRRKKILVSSCSDDEEDSKPKKLDLNDSDEEILKMNKDALPKATRRRRKLFVSSESEAEEEAYNPGEDYVPPQDENYF